LIVRRLRVFVDTSAFFALLDRRDASHSEAIQVQQALTSGRAQLFTSNFIVAECHALLLTRLSRADALAFLDGFATGFITVVAVTPEDETRAVDIIRRYDDKMFSYVDASSFAVMERLGLGHAFDFDRHFSQYGFITVAPP
jgi:predicted nucleic acid-binding protein